MYKMFVKCTIFYIIILINYGSYGFAYKEVRVNELPPSSSSSPSSAGRALYSPVEEFNNKWMPVGRGDPLKNDPTFDYSPPVLDRVKYWTRNGDNNNNGGNINNKNEILLLGVSSKQPIYYNNLDNNNKQPTIRNNYFPHLPTVLMPPPMQPIMMQELSLNQKSNELPHINKMLLHNTNYVQSKWTKHTSADDALADESHRFVNIAEPFARYVNYTSDYSSQINELSEIQNGKPTMNIQPEEVQSYAHPQAFISNKINTSQPHKKPWIQSLLQKEVTKPSTYVSMESAPTVFESHSIVESPSSGYKSNWMETTTQHYFEPTIPPSTKMTTDTLFSHYKQPEKPMDGPMYLIIQGHSKVKTYGGQPSDGKLRPKIVPVESTGHPVNVRVVANDDEGRILNVKHLHTKQSTGVTSDADQSTPLKENLTDPANSTTTSRTSESLISLLDTEFGDFLDLNNDMPEDDKSSNV